MGTKSGDKSRHFRAVRKRNAKRVAMRALRKQLTAAKAAPPAAVNAPKA